MRAIVLTFDHLPRSLLGCYGNIWIETPQLDRLAAGCTVFDACYSADLTAAARECCESHSTSPPVASPWSATWNMLARRAGEPAPLDHLRAGGVRTILIAEGGSDLADARGFDETVHVGGDDSADAALSDRPFSQLVAKAVERWRESPPADASLLWLASRGVPSPWQPPRAIAGIYWEEFFEAESLAQVLAAALGDDPAASSGPGSEDPDQWLGRCIHRLPAAGLLHRGPAPELEEFQALSRLTYAACLSAIDATCGELFDAIGPRADDVLLIVTSAAGELLVEHPCVAHGCPPIVDALARVPLLVRYGRGEAVGSRRNALVSTADVAATLVEWFLSCDGSESGARGSLLPLVRCERDGIREDMLFGAEQIGWGVRTPDFSCLCRAEGGTDGAPPTLGRPWLFHKPDDAGDLLDIADQYPEESESLAQRVGAMAELHALTPTAPAV